MIKKFLFLPILLLLQAAGCFATFHLDKSKKQSVCIVIPAYNEEDRIEKTLKTYVEYFRKIDFLDVDLLVVANNCSDKTVQICKKQQKKYKEIDLIDLAPGGKGFAVKKGFEKALEHDYDLIGFVDADMATLPQYFYDLVEATDNHDGAIASRYCKGAKLPGKKSFLRKLSGNFFNWIVKKRFNFSFEDTQCGAKLFTYDTVQAVTPDMYENKWYFDIELLYLCTINGKDINEIPTTWEDQPGSHFQLNTDRLKELFLGQGKVLKRHAKKAKKYLANQKEIAKEARKEKRTLQKSKKKSKKEKRAEKKAKKKALKKARILKRAKHRKAKKKSSRYLI